MTTQEKIGLKIKSLREEQNISQTTLAERVGYKDKTAIAKVEAGKVDLPQSKLVAFANALGTNPSFFFNEQKNVEINPKDERDIARDLDNIMSKLTDGEAGPAAYDGEELSPEAAELFRDEIEIALRRLKLINKEKYNPNKNKK